VHPLFSKEAADIVDCLEAVHSVILELRNVRAFPSFGPPGRCSGCRPHDGEVAGGAVADLDLLISKPPR
jgi:hypothetical protein